ncbi:putative serine/threonine-protein kinase MAK, partial [Listeria ivanovii FSL F6-596]
LVKNTKVSKIFSAKKKTGIIIVIKHANLITVKKIIQEVLYFVN